MPKEEQKVAGNNKFISMRAHNGWLYGLLAVLAVAVVFAAGMTAARYHDDRVAIKRSIAAGFIEGDGFGAKEHGFMMFGGHMGGQALGESITINGQTRASGVVTGVNGSNFTIAGSGAVANVTTNSSTSYQNGNQVKQNDTVVVLGTSSNNTLTATRVVINP